MGWRHGSRASLRCMRRWASGWQSRGMCSGSERSCGCLTSQSRDLGTRIVLLRAWCCSELADEVGGGEAFDGGDDLDAAAGGENVFVADDGLDSVFAHFDKGDR